MALTRSLAAKAISLLLTELVKKHVIPGKKIVK